MNKGAMTRGCSAIVVYLASVLAGVSQVPAQTTGSIVAWGDNSYGQRNVPAPNTGFVHIAAGDYFSLAIRASILVGDVNCDGLIDGGDIGAFVLALLDADRFHAAHPGCPIRNADLNRDSLINTSDVVPFVSCLLDTGCP